MGSEYFSLLFLRTMRYTSARRINVKLSDRVNNVIIARNKQTGVAAINKYQWFLIFNSFSTL